MNNISQTIFDGTLADLLSLKYQPELSSSGYRFYHMALLGYLKKDKKQLREALDLETNNNLKSLISLRSKILNKSLEVDDIEDIKYQAMGSEVKGEALFVIASSYKFLKDYETASRFYLLSAHCLDQNGFKKKSSLAIHNYIVMLSEIETDKSYIDDFKYCLKYAEDRFAIEVQSLCLYNLSLGYQLFGAFDTALFYIEAAIDRMENSYGSKQYYLFRSQQFDLFIKMGRILEANSIADELKASSIDHYKRVEKVLKNYQLNEQLDDLPSSWQWKLQGNFKQNKLGTLEEKLLVYISSGVRSKHDLIDYLYPGKGEYLSKVNRFNVLMSRLKKKCPNMILKSKDGYTLQKSSSIA